VNLVTTQVKQAPRPAAQPQQRQLLIIGAVVVIAAVVLVVAITLSGRVNTVEIDYASIPQSRTSDGGFVLGDPNAPITIIEFADWACPHCQSYHPEVQRFVRDFVLTGRARFEYRTLPTAGGANTQFAAQIAECADEAQPGAFWQMYKIYYDLALSARFNDEAGRTAATQLGLNYSDLLSCSSSATQVSTDVRLAQSLGATGTPAVFMRVGDGAPPAGAHARHR
jgi:protein-disulfide isomerase